MQNCNLDVLLKLGYKNVIFFKKPTTIILLTIFITISNMFKIAEDFLVGLGIYISIIMLSLCALFFILRKFKKENNPPILHTIILFMHYTWLIISLVMSYYTLWHIVTSISFIYLITIAPLFSIFFTSKYYHLRHRTSYFRNLYWFSLIYLILIPIWTFTLLYY